MTEDQQDALDKELENFTDQKNQELEGWDEYLTNVEVVVSDALATIQANTDVVYQTLREMGHEYGLSITESLTAPWEQGEYAIQSFSEKFGSSMSSTVDELEKLADKYKEIMEDIEDYGKEVIDSVEDNAEDYVSAKQKEDLREKYKENKPQTQNKPQTPATQTYQPQQAAPSLSYGSSVVIKSSATHFSSNSGGARMASFVPGGTYTVYETSGDQVLIGRNGVYTGWVRMSDIEGYAKGTKGVKKDQWAFVDELGDELQLVPDGNGRLDYIKKGTSILNNAMTERLMDLAMNPQDMLDRSRPSITPSHSVINTEIKLDCSVGELVHIEHCDQNTLPDVEKIVNKAFDKHMQNLNNSLKRYTR